MALRKFTHPTAGSNTITPTGEVLTFSGPAGGRGAVVLDDSNPESSGAIAHLEALCKKRVVGMYEEVDGPESATIVVDAAAVRALEDTMNSAIHAQTATAVSDNFETQMASGQQVGVIGNLEGSKEIIPAQNQKLTPEAQAALARVSGLANKS